MLTYSHMVTQVDIWTTNLGSAEIAPDICETLSPDELERADRLLFKRDRYSFMASRSILRHVLGEYLNVSANSILFTYSATGRPELAGTHAGKIRFSLSHSEKLTLFAFSRHCEIGIDVEYMRPFPNLEEVLARFFSARELRELRSLPARSRTPAFYKLWTRREALIKGMGKSLAVLDEKSTDMCLDRAQQSTASNEGAEGASGWLIQNVYPAPGYVGAFAVRTRKIRTRYHTYNSKLLMAA